MNHFINRNHNHNQFQTMWLIAIELENKEKPKANIIVINSSQKVHCFWDLNLNLKITKLFRVHKKKTTEILDSMISIMNSEYAIKIEPETVESVVIISAFFCFFFFFFWLKFCFIRLDEIQLNTKWQCIRNSSAFFFVFYHGFPVYAPAKQLHTRNQQHRKQKRTEEWTTKQSHGL